MGEKKSKTEYSSSFRIGAVCLAFLIIGYELALFIHKASVERIEAMRDHPDTVYVVDSALAAALLSEMYGIPVGSSAVGSSSVGASGGASGRSGAVSRFGGGATDSRCASDTRGASYPRCASDTRGASGPSSGASFSGGAGVVSRSKGGASCGSGVVIKKQTPHSETVERIRENSRRVESFTFDPNTVSVGDLQRLGFTGKQAQSIDNYRRKGGRFRRKSDFAKSYVVTDSVYRRLEPFIDIPKLDINKADSADFDTLPGIGGYFAAKMVSYRNALGGYSCKEQLMEIYHFDREKFDALSDLIICTPPADSFRLWTLPIDSLRHHPHIHGYATARAIVFYREHNPRSRWTVEALLEAGVIDDDAASRLSRCAIARP